MSAQYNVPLQLNAQNGDDYVIDDGYPHDGVTPPGMGWDGQSDGGGKFRLKRRRRCGQCGPCQVKENCNKCQYCMRKDVLKQACVYRKCVYLRKPVPRFRQEPTPTGSVSHKSVPTPPHKPTLTPVPPAPVSAANTSNSSNGAATNSGTTSNSNNSSTPVSNPGVSSPSSVGPVSHAAELSSCRLNQSPFATMSAMQSMNNGVLDPLRHRMMEQPHRSLFESMNHHHSLDPPRSVLDPSKPVMADMSRFTGGPALPSLSSHCKLDQAATVVSHANSMSTATVSSLNSMNSALGSHHAHHQSSKCPTSLPPRDPCFPSMDTWSSMPYALPHTSAWAAPALPSHHVAAATYGFPQHSASFQSSFSPSSCQLGMPDPTTSRFVSPASAQHSFHHSMTMAGFSQDFAHATSNHSSHANIRTPMSPPFYPAPHHISPSSIHSFPGLSQFSASQASFGPAAYSMHPHAHMYPGSFYSFRAASEPQIYHVQIYPSHNPFRYSLQQIPLISQNEKGLDVKNDNSEFDFSGDKNICSDIWDRQYLEICSSGIIQTNSPEKDLISSYPLNTVNVLGKEEWKCSSSVGSITQHSCSNIDLVDDKCELLDGSSEKAALIFVLSKEKALLKNTDCDSSCSGKNSSIENFESSSTNKILKYDDEGCSCTEQFPQSGSIDQDLQDHLSWICHGLECDDFHSENEDLSLTLCGRTMELASDQCSDDDDDSKDADCPQVQIGKPVCSVVHAESSSFLSQRMKIRPQVSQTNISGAFVLPAILSSSSHLPSAIDSIDLCSNEEEQIQNCAKGSDKYQNCYNVLLRAHHKNLTSNNQMRTIRHLKKRKLPFSELKQKYPKRKRNERLNRPCRKLPSKTNTSSQDAVLNLLPSYPSGGEPSLDSAKTAPSKEPLLDSSEIEISNDPTLNSS